MRAALLLAAALSLSACQGEAATTPEGIAADPGGTYRRSEPAGGQLTITREGEDWRLRIVAGGVPSGAGTAADCELEAVGPMVGDQILGTLVPFEGEIGGLTAADIGDAPGRILATLADDGSALVTEEAASSRHCGMGSDLSGTYAPES